jgi:hypothetical protein
MGLAILGLGCSVPLTIGPDDLNNSTGGLPPAEDSGTPGSGDDAGNPADSGVSGGGENDAGVLDAGSCLAVGDSSQYFSLCCSHDSSQGFCRDPSAWSCTAQRICYWDGGSCASTGHSCVGYGDCCSGGCFEGTCQNANDSLLTGPIMACTKYSDCAPGPENCFMGHCAQAPQPCTGGQYQQKCTKWSDCCSLECNDGSCQDTTLPKWLQSAPEMKDQLPLQYTTPMAADYFSVPSLTDNPANRAVDSSTSNPAK